MDEAQKQAMAEAVARIRENMTTAAKAAGRDPGEVLLCAACKTRTVEEVRYSADLPIDLFGENHVQELVEKTDAGAYNGKPGHFIGHLQTNKVNKVVGRAALIQSVDSTRLLDKIEAAAERLGITQEILMEINIGAEESKSGVGPDDLWPLLDAAAAKGEPPLLVVCDEISDPHNLGAILRTAECAGAHGLIIPKRRSAGLTAIVGKTSAGADSYLPVARVANLTSVLKDLKKQGVWIFGTAAGASTDLYSADLKGPAAIVIGSEGDGMSRLVAENCDFLVSIPMKGHISSLNASAAAAILLYEAVRQRRG